MNLSHLPRRRTATGPNKGAGSYLNDAEWSEVRETIKRGVSPGAIYPEVADRYKSLGAFRRAIENRYGSITDIRHEDR